MVEYSNFNFHQSDENVLVCCLLKNEKDKKKTQPNSINFPDLAIIKPISVGSGIVNDCCITSREVKLNDKTQ